MLPFASISDLHRAYREGVLTPLEVVEHYEQVIQERDALINAFITPTLELAREQAASLSNAEPASPVWGVPLAIKDNIAVEDVELTCGSRILLGYRAPYDATAVARLRNAGAIFLGKANMDEFAMGSSGETSHFGPTRNPLNPEFVPGGSSSGSAAAVAAGEALAALGSDTGGSIRQPAAFTGLVGLKPTYGRVSRYGLVAFASSLDQIGPLTLTVDDALRIYAVIAGEDPRDPTTLEDPVPPYPELLQIVQGLSIRTIGVIRNFLESPQLDARIRERMEEVIRTLEGEGFRIRAVELPSQRYAIPTYYLIATSEASSNLARYDGTRYGFREEGEDLLSMYARTRGKGFGREVKRRILLGTFALSAGYAEAFYLRALKVRRMILEDFARAFEEVDILLAPTTPYFPFRIGEKKDPLELYLADLFTVGVNLAGLPALAQPAGRVDGWPVSLQWIAPHGEEIRLFHMAFHVERFYREGFHGP